jgi:acetolactate synthase regulatory subunit
MSRFDLYSRMRRRRTEEVGQLTVCVRPEQRVVADILNSVRQNGFYLRSIRVIPCRSGEASTLHLSLGGHGSSGHFKTLLKQIEQLEDVLRPIL